MGGPDVLVDAFGCERTVSAFDCGTDGAVVGPQLISDPLPVRPERMQRVQDGATYGVAQGDGHVRHQPVSAGLSDRHMERRVQVVERFLD